MQQTRFIDSHVHLDAPQFDEDREAMITRGREAGIAGFITIGAGYGRDSARKACQIAEENADIWATVGVHPLDAGVADGCFIETLQELAQNQKVVGIGETGLDFYHDKSPADKQYQWFEAQISLAKELKKPLVIHSRSAGAECLEVITRTGARDVGGVFHCFAEDSTFAKKLLDLNFIVSFPGIITFKNAAATQEAARAIPLSSILLETDAPFLAPTPYRGKRCESAYLPHTAQKLAELKGISLEEVAATTYETTCRIFGISP